MSAVCFLPAAFVDRLQSYRMRTLMGEESGDIGRPSKETKSCVRACSRSGVCSSPAGKPLRLVMLVDVGVLKPELEFNWRYALSMSYSITANPVPSGLCLISTTRKLSCKGMRVLRYFLVKLCKFHPKNVDLSFLF